MDVVDPSTGKHGCPFSTPQTVPSTSGPRSPRVSPACPLCRSSPARLPCAGAPPLVSPVQLPSALPELPRPTPPRIRRPVASRDNRAKSAEEQQQQQHGTAQSEEQQQQQHGTAQSEEQQQQQHGTAQSEEQQQQHGQSSTGGRGEAAARAHGQGRRSSTAARGSSRRTRGRSRRTRASSWSTGSLASSSSDSRGVAHHHHHNQPAAEADQRSG